MSIAMVNGSPVAIYREEQWFNGWIYAVLGTLAALAVVGAVWFQDVGRPPEGWPDWLKQPLTIALGLSLPPMLVVGLLRMTTEVYPTELRIWFGLLPTYRHIVPLAEIRAVEPVRYRPLVDCGGWGILRGRNGERVFTAKGNRGVRLTLRDGSTLLIGSQRPEDLARILDRAVRELA